MTEMWLALGNSLAGSGAVFFAIVAASGLIGPALFQRFGILPWWWCFVVHRLVGARVAWTIMDDTRMSRARLSMDAVLG